MMPFEDTKILEFNQHQISGKTPFIIYPDLKFLMEKYCVRFFNVCNIVI